MRIVIDGYWWSKGPFSNRMVLLEIVDRWCTDFPDDELVLAVRDDQSGPSAPKGVKTVRTSLRLHPAINFIELPSIARRHSADAILAFNFAANSRTGVVFLHDVLFQSNPEWFTRVERAYFSGMPLLAKRARTVIATTDSERERIQRLNPRLRRVTTCGLTVPSALEDEQPADPGLGLAGGSYLLSVGRLNVRKNLAMTLRATIQSGVLSETFPLVVVGEPSGQIQSFDDEFREAVDRGHILIVERVSSSELKWLYSHSALFLCLSLDEGFGLPPVEALSLGCPVLTSDIPVFRETVGSHAAFVDPTDAEAIAKSIRNLTSECSVRPNDYLPPHSWSSVCSAIRNELL